MSARYKLKQEVRLSLYDECDKWMQAVGKKEQFLGGDRPNLADLVRICFKIIYPGRRKDLGTVSLKKELLKMHH